MAGWKKENMLRHFYLPLQILSPSCFVLPLPLELICTHLHLSNNFSCSLLPGSCVAQENPGNLLEGGRRVRLELLLHQLPPSRVAMGSCVS